MYSISEYNNQNINLAKTLIVKLTDVGIAMNIGLKNKYGITASTDKRTWKYFLNMSGQKHSTNTDVTITIIELGTKEVLTKELLDKYSYTRTELLRQEDYYKNIIRDYPEEITFIHGCMLPVDIDKAIEAEDGTILNYNTNFVEDSEDYLIPKLQEHIKNFLQRWHISEYTIVEELYLPGMLANLYASLPTKIANLRLDKVNTNEVHSFHMEHFFRSHLNIWDELNVLNNKTKYWLYRNLPYLIRNIGKHSTFNLIIDKILNENDVGVGRYILRKSNPELNNETDINKSSYNSSQLSIYASAVNPYYSNDGFKDIDSTIIKELDETSTLYTEEENFVIDRIKDKILNSEIDNQYSKMIELSTYEYYKQYGIDLFKYVFDYWVYNVKKDNIQYNVEFTDPNTNNIYILSAKQGLLLLIKLMLNLFNNNDLVLTNINYDLILESDSSSIDSAYNKMFNDGYTNIFFQDLKNNYPVIDRISTTVENFNSYLMEIIDYISYVWILDTNSESLFTSANMKMMLQLTTQKGVYSLVYLNKTEDELGIEKGKFYGTDTDVDDLLVSKGTNYDQDTNEDQLLLSSHASYNLESAGKTIDELLDEENMYINITSGYDIMTSIVELIKAFTGVNIHAYEVINNISDSFKSLLNKLTAYTSQIITQDTGEDTISIYYNNINIMKSRLGILNLKDGYLKALEEDYAKLNTISLNVYDKLDAILETNIGIRTSELKDADLFKGTVEIYPDVGMAWIAPQFRVEVIDDNEYEYDKELENYILSKK